MEALQVAQFGNSSALDTGADDRVIELWLQTKASDNTREAYARDVADFQNWLNKPLRALILDDVLAYSRKLEADNYGPRSRRRKLAAIKSLISFGHRIGLLPFDAGKAVPLPAIKNDMAERILSEEDLLRMIALESDRRNQALIRLLYVSGGRVSEICGASWRDLQSREEGGQICLFGKRGKTRYVLLPEKLWRDLQEMREGADDSSPLFLSREGQRLGRVQAWRVVKAAAKRAGLKWSVSPHWMRHSHASHALERGASVGLVKDTLGHESLQTTTQYVHVRPESSSSEHLAIS